MTLRTLEEVVEYYRPGIKVLADARPDLNAFVDQTGARIAEQLKELDIDVNNPGHARLLGAFSAYLVQAGWDAAGTDRPMTGHQFAEAYFGTARVFNSIGSLIVQKHGGSDV